MRKQTFLLLSLFGWAGANAQNVGIGTTTPAPSAILDVNSTNKGLLIPRMTTAQRNAIASPVVGLQIFNMDDQCTDIYDGANWIKSCGLKVISTITDPGHPTPNSWIPKAAFGGSLRYNAVGFSIGNKGYIGTGMGTNGSSGSSNDFWEYNPATNAWAQKAPIGETRREGAVGFSIGSKGYIGTGSTSGNFKKDFWEYDPATNVWTQKAPFGGAERFNAVGFSIGNKGYVGSGYNGNYLNDFWEYDPTADTWTSKAPFGGAARYSAVGFSIGSKGYLGTGKNVSDPQNDFWEYDPATNVWTQKAPFGGAARYSAVGFSIGSKGYVGTGYNGNYLNDFWEYIPSTNAWMQKAILDGLGRSEAVGFSIGSKGYIGTGQEGNFAISNNFWEYLDDNVTNIAYSSNSVSTLNNTVTDGAWTLANGTAYNANVGNVGIGTSTPVAKFDVIGNIKTSTTLTVGGLSTEGIVTNSAAGLLGTVSTVPVSYGGTGANALTGYVFGNGTGAFTSNTTIAGTAITGDIAGNAANVTGIVGVTKGGTGTSTAFTAGSIPFTGTGGVYAQNNTNLFWDNTNARLGIGTAMPQAKLNVSGNGGPALRLDAVANTTAFSMSGTGSFNIDAVGIIGGRLAVKEDGKVGVGTAAPTELLEVNGTLKAQTLNAQTLNAAAWKTQSATPVGYANMGGVVMQWGTVNYSNSSAQSINFPVAFTEVFSVTLTIDNNNSTNSAGSNVPPKLVAVGNASFQMGGTQTFNNDNTCKVRWMAVGR